jgi:hypothetical protein
MNFMPYIDQQMIVQADHDSGDSSQRMGTYWTLGPLAGLSRQELESQIGQDYETSMKAHEASEGLYRRSNDPLFWGHNPNNFSRDQWSILQLSWAVNSDYKRLWASMKALIGRKLLHQNVHPGTDAPPEFRKFPDIAHPSHFATFIRGMNAWYAYPVLCVLDLTLVGDLYFRRPSWDYDNMMAQHLLYANLKYPTIASKTAMYFYPVSDAMSKIETYHSLQKNGIPPLAELFKLAYTKNGYLKP